MPGAPGYRAAPGQQGKRDRCDERRAFMARVQFASVGFENNACTMKSKTIMTIACRGGVVHEPSFSVDSSKFAFGSRRCAKRSHP